MSLARFTAEYVTGPYNTAVPTLSGTGGVGNSISTSNGTWSPTPTSYTYQWQRGGLNIPGAVNTSYTLTPFDVGVALTCVVIATDSSGYTSSAIASSSYTPTGDTYTTSSVNGVVFGPPGVV